MTTWTAQKWWTFAAVTSNRFEINVRLNSYGEDWRFFIGRVIAGRFWEPDRNIEDRWRVIREDPLRLNQNAGAYIENPRYASYRTAIVRFPACDTAQKNRLEEIALPGKTSPLVVNLDEDNPDSDTLYGRVVQTTATSLPGGAYYDIDAIYKRSRDAASPTFAVSGTRHRPARAGAGVACSRPPLLQALGAQTGLFFRREIRASMAGSAIAGVADRAIVGHRSLRGGG